MANRPRPANRNPGAKVRERLATLKVNRSAKVQKPVIDMSSLAKLSQSAHPVTPLRAKRLSALKSHFPNLGK